MTYILLLDGVTKYLTAGTRQTKYIVGSNRKQKPDYWDRHRKVIGKTPVNEEHDYWQLQRNLEAIGWDHLLRRVHEKVNNIERNILYIFINGARRNFTMIGQSVDEC